MAMSFPLAGPSNSTLPQCSIARLQVPRRHEQRRLRRSSVEKMRVARIIRSAATAEGEMKKRLGPLSKDKSKVVFVAGATGRLGSKTVRELLKLGFKVRAGARSEEKFQSILGDLLETTSTNGVSPGFSPGNIFGFMEPKKQEPRLQFVQLDLENPADIEQALGDSSVVICVIGASESRVLDVTGPYRIDYQATKNLIDAAKNADVNHFIHLTSLGTTKFGWPAAVLNLFWGVLIWKEKAEKVLVNSGLSYSIVRPGGMERPTDAFKETHNLKLGPKDSFTGGQVSRLQVAELLACIAKNLELAENQIVEAIAETTAPLRPIEELLAELPVEAEKSTAKERKKPASDMKAAADEEQLRKKFEAELRELKESERIASTEAQALQAKRIEISAEAEAAAAAAARARALADAVIESAKSGKLLSEEEKQKILNREVEQEKASSSMASRKRVSSGKKTVEVPETAQRKNDLPAKAARKMKANVKDSSIKEEKVRAALPVKDSREDVSKAAEDSSEKRTEQTKRPSAPVPRAPSAGNISAKSATAEAESQETKEKEKGGFRWPWERKSSPPDVSERLSPKASYSSLKTPATPRIDDAAKDPISKPLSPYARYPDLKPPVSPGPAVPNVDKDGSLPKASQGTPRVDKEVSSLSKAVEKPIDVDTPAKKKASAFVWPWQKKDSKNPGSISSEQGTGSAREADSSPVSATNDVLSPYTSDPDVKPPTSTSLSATEASVEDRPLSPYANFPDLKPPASPTPTASKVDTEEPKAAEKPASPTAYSASVREREAADLAKAKASVLWPWEKRNSKDAGPGPKDQGGPSPQAAVASKDEEGAKSGLSPYPSYADLKPPSSPSPSPPEAAVQVPDSRSLSPYAAYPDLKPPASPTPTVPRADKVEPKAAEQPKPDVQSSPKAYSTIVREREAAALAKAKAYALVWPPWKKGGSSS